MKKAQITRSWIVYPPDYDWRKNDPYFKIPFLKDAWNKACSLGVGSEVHMRSTKVFRNGAKHHSMGGDRYYFVTKDDV